MNRQIIIFSHYGYSNYLELTLACAKKTNPLARLIFLGDIKNKEVAESCGWEHYFLDSYHSDLTLRFENVFQHIQGKNHNHIKNGNDWLKFVFERWFFIECFISTHKIDRFWHFDSDTMIVKELSKAAQNLLNYDFTVQCNNTCLNGVMNRDIVSAYCKHICDLFEDTEFIAEQKLEFETVHPEYAFTEMSAFDDYKKKSDFRWANLMLYSDEYVFDDCICQSHGFSMTKLLGGGRLVKDIEVIDGNFFGYRDGQKIKFITLNLSWVHPYIFRWVLDSLDYKGHRYLRNSYPTLSEAFLVFLARLKLKLRNLINSH